MDSGFMKAVDSSVIATPSVIFAIQGAQHA
jgi:hypothetical protein